MKADRLLVAAAAFYVLGGVGLTFAPDELLAAMGAGGSRESAWVAQILGGALLGLGWLAWLSRFSPMGGIYGRPLLLTNLMFLLVATGSSLSAWRHGAGSSTVWAAGAFGLLALAFGRRLRAPPSRLPGD